MTVEFLYRDLEKPRFSDLLFEDLPLSLRTTISTPDDYDAGRLIEVEFVAVAITADGRAVEAQVASARAFELPFVFEEDLEEPVFQNAVYFPADSVNDNISSVAQKLLLHLDAARKQAEQDGSDGVLLIDYVRVEAPFRGLGLGHLLLAAIRSSMVGINLTALEPSPILEDDDVVVDEESCAALARHWIKDRKSRFKALGAARKDRVLTAVWSFDRFDNAALRAIDIPEHLLVEEGLAA